MKLALILLAATAVAQTPAPKPAPPQLQNCHDVENCSGNVSGNVCSGYAICDPWPPTFLTLPHDLHDLHGCGSGFTWDDGRKSCAIHVTFTGQSGPITCSPVSADANGDQHMVCWYTPTPEHKEPK